MSQSAEVDDELLEQIHLDTTELECNVDHGTNLVTQPVSTMIQSAERVLVEVNNDA